jgi:hypothetical protein
MAFDDIPEKVCFYALGKLAPFLVAFLLIMLVVDGIGYVLAVLSQALLELWTEFSEILLQFWQGICEMRWVIIAALIFFFVGGPIFAFLISLDEAMTKRNPPTFSAFAKDFWVTFFGLKGSGRKRSRRTSSRQRHAPTEECRKSYWHRYRIASANGTQIAPNHYRSKIRRSVSHAMPLSGRKSNSWQRSKEQRGGRKGGHDYP